MKKKQNRNFAELNKEPRLIRKEKVSWELRKDVINIVNTRIGLSNVNSESVKDSLVNSDINSTILPRSDNEQILNPQKRSTSFSKVQSIEATSANKKEDISGNRIIDANILSGVFCELLCMMRDNVPWFLVKDMKKSKDLHHCCI